MTLAISGFLLLLPCAALLSAAYALAGARREVSTERATDAADETLERTNLPFGGTGTGRVGLAKYAGLALATGVVALAFLASLQLYVAFRVVTDDAPITFRYAENLAEGRGFVYNDGERVLGTSTPLFTLALAGLRLAGVPVGTGALLLNLAAVAALVTLIFRCGRLLPSKAAAWLAAALVCTEAPFLVYSTQGMETTVYLVLILGTLVCHMEGREVPAAALAALCVLMRLDGLAVPAALAIGYLAERRRPSRGTLLVFGALLIPWLLFSWSYFGHLLPQSMLAKLAHHKYSDRWWMLRTLFLEGRLLFVPFGLLGAVLVCQGKGGARRAVLPAWLALYAGAFTCVTIDAYPWYRIPLVPVMALLAAVGVHVSVTALLRAWPGGPRRVALGVVMVAALPWAAARYFVYHDSLVAYSDQLRVGELPRIAAAEWLLDHALPGSRVATAGIGHIGWISGLRILDTSGLVSPELLGSFDVGRERPEFVVGHDEGALPDGVFRVDHPDYGLVKSIAVEDSVLYRIYKRKDTPLK